MSKLFKKFLASFLVAVFLLISIATPSAKAQTPGEWYSQNFDQWYQKVYDTQNPQEIFGERYTAAQVQWVIYSLFAFIIRGAANGNTQALQCLFTQDALSCLKSVPSIKFLSIETNNKNLLQAITENRPLSGIGYTKQLLGKFQLIPSAQAQAAPGFGFSALGPIQSLWSVSRNITYTLFVVVILIMAFMIMFRVKLSPQTVITVQSALPKIAVGIILITFSYAIAGFLIDLMYVIIGFISLLFSTGKGDPGSSLAIFNLLTRGPENLGVFGLIIGYLLLLFIAIVILLTKLQLLSGIFGIILFIVVLIATIFISIKIIWLLVRSFAMIFIMTIFAPFQILFGTLIPSFGFGSWVKSFIANLAVFPTVGTMFLLSYLFIFSVIAKYSSTLLSGSTTSALLIPNTTNPVSGWPPLITPDTQFYDLMFLAASFVIFSLIPKSADFIKSMIEGKPFAFGTAIGENVAPAMGLGAAVVGADVAKYEADAKQHNMSTWEWVRTLPPQEQVRYLMAAGGRRLLTRR